MTEKTTFQIIADGLDASTDGRGWGAEHESARILANEAPGLLAALRDCVEQMEQCEKMFRDDLDFMTALDAARAILSRIDNASEPDADLRESSSGYHCSACGREEADCSAEPCVAVIADREA
jgi:hypothetical protein